MTRQGGTFFDPETGKPMRLDGGNVLPERCRQCGTMIPSGVDACPRCGRLRPSAAQAARRTQAGRVLTVEDALPASGAGTMVRTYADQAAYALDAKRLSAAGWTVQAVTERQPPIGIQRGCLLGLLALVWRPKPQLVVTYQRAELGRL